LHAVARGYSRSECCSDDKTVAALRVNFFLKPTH